MRGQMPPFDGSRNIVDGPQAANQVTVSDGNGDAAFYFSVPFSAPPVVVATGGNGEIVWIRPDTVSAIGFIARFVNGAGAPIVGNVRLFWTAMPATQ